MKRPNRFLSIACYAALVACPLAACSETENPWKVTSFTSQPAEPAPAPTTDPWVLIDSKHEQLTVYKGGKQIATFSNLAFGAAGVRKKRRRGDDVTPTGRFTISSISSASKFRIFIALNYPTVEYAKQGLADGIINKQTFDRIKSAIDHGETPPQNTPLGGLIGIHGVGRGDSGIHQLVNWTSGCIALENDQIEKLAPLLHPGVMVEIR